MLIDGMVEIQPYDSVGLLYQYAYGATLRFTEALDSLIPLFPFFDPIKLMRRINLPFVGSIVGYLSDRVYLPPSSASVCRS